MRKNAWAPAAGVSVGLLVMLAVASGCKSPTLPSAGGGYIITSAPIDTGVTAPALCIAVNTAEPAGVWWWQPGHKGCETRSSGPGLFRGIQVAVTAGTSSQLEVRFQLKVISVQHPSGELVEVALVLEDQSMRAQASGARVPTHRRSNLVIPPE
jgi:hypothetical protein